MTLAPEVLPNVGIDIHCANPKLSILIPVHIDQDYKAYLNLLSSLIRQVYGDVEILSLRNRGEKPIGAFRNQLVNSAKGEYIVFVDADDQVHPQYIEKILKAIESKPDTVGFWVRRLIDNKLVGRAKHSNEFSGFEDRQRSGYTEFDRCPNHLNPTRAELVRKIKFVEITEGEDRDYALRLKMAGLVKTQVFLDVEMYDYLKVTPNELVHRTHPH